MNTTTHKTGLWLVRLSSAITDERCLREVFTQDEYYTHTQEDAVALAHVAFEAVRASPAYTNHVRRIVREEVEVTSECVRLRLWLEERTHKVLDVRSQVVVDGVTYHRADQRVEYGDWLPVKDKYRANGYTDIRIWISEHAVKLWVAGWVQP